MKKISIPISKYIQIIKPTYIYLKLTPDTSIRNYNSTNIAKSISHMYKNILNRTTKERKKFSIETPVKCSYMIDIYKDKVNFYFIIPKQYASIIKEKIHETWNRITIEEVKGITPFSINVLKYQLNYKKEDALSLNINKKNNEPLNSILNVLDIVKDSDRIGIFYNFIPTSQFGWKKQYQDTINKFKKNIPIDKEKTNILYILKMVANLLLEILQIITDTLNDFCGNPSLSPSKNSNFLEVASELFNNKLLSNTTKKKKELEILNTQLLVISDSIDTIRQQNNALSVCQSYKSIEEDNELIYKKVSKKHVFHLTDFRVAGVNENKISVEECHNFLQLPGKDLLDQHKSIEKIDTLESPIPDELQTGIMCIGESEYKGTKKKAFLSTDREFKNLTLCLIGPTRSGKTTLISNLSKDSIKTGETTIIFDYCGNCDLSNDVSSVINKKNILNIDCSDFNNLQGLGYNEITPLNDNLFEKYRCAKTKATQLLTLINSINSCDSDLKARMERYLEAASVIVFISNGSIKNVFDVLQDHTIRHNFLNKIPQEQNNNLDEYIRALKELNELSKPSKNNSQEIIGTKISFVQGILNRVSKLKQNTYMELMLKSDCNNNIDLVKEIQKSQLICIRMPEIMFSTEQEKDIYCTYWLTKIWGALQVRKWNIPKAKDRIKVNIIFDELYQVPNCQNFLRSKLSQIAKFSCKPIISCHYLGQIPLIRNELKAANSSYMLISGCDKDNFKELNEELNPYTLDDLLHLKRYYSLNLIKYEKGWSKFITKLPLPIV